MAKRYAHDVTHVHAWQSMDTLPKPKYPISEEGLPCLTWKLIAVVGNRFYWEREYDVPDK